MASELDHNKSTFITELKYKLTPLLSQAMAGDVSRLKDLYEYAQQYQLVYQNLKDIELQTSVANFGGNRYQETNKNTNTKTAG